MTGVTPGKKRRAGWNEAPAEPYSRRKTSRENAERRRTWRAAGLADGAVQDQIQDSINDEVARARRNLPKGESLHFCEECGEPIPEARRKALPGVRLCVACQEEADKDQRAVSLYNRRGSKDSQLR